MSGDLMTKEELRRLAPWGAIAFGVLGVFLLELWFEGVCTDASLSKELGIDKAGSCFEFWLNRYQSLMGAVAAVAAALYAANKAWKAAKLQISKAQEQVAAANGQLFEVQQQTSLVNCQAAAARAVEIRKMVEAAIEVETYATQLLNRLPGVKFLYHEVSYKLSNYTSGLDQSTGAIKKSNKASLIDAISRLRVEMGECELITKRVRSKMNLFWWPDSSKINYDYFVYMAAYQTYGEHCNNVAAIASLSCETLNKDGVANGFLAGLPQLLSQDFILKMEKSLFCAPGDVRRITRILQAELRDALGATIGKSS